MNKFLIQLIIGKLKKVAKMDFDGIDKTMMLFKHWDKYIVDYSLKNIDVKVDPILSNDIKREQLRRKLKDPSVVRMCLILFQAKKDNKAPYSLRSLADSMGASKKEDKDNRLMQAKLRKSIDDLSIYGLFNKRLSSGKCFKYKIEATDKLVSFFNK